MQHLPNDRNSNVGSQKKKIVDVKDCRRTNPALDEENLQNEMMMLLQRPPLHIIILAHGTHTQTKQMATQTEKLFPSRWTFV